MIQQLEKLLKQAKSCSYSEIPWDLVNARDNAINALRDNSISRDELKQFKDTLDRVDEVLANYFDSEYGWSDYQVWHELLPEELQDPSDKERIRKQRDDAWEEWYDHIYG